ncbi:T9SS type B sorting domain-containing protein [Flavobacterium sp. UBA7682]|uniref:DUF7948 domain-containing protein n=1 Tax=Flavobacterium sp. UBA7682 TaxID=1946560 RepID=UPI0025C4D5B2|nr:T9SS type B sorting domain-containing protein [Flavobacterium sp. UBA7682]
MKKLFVLCFLTICTFSLAQNQNQSVGFIENKGQIIDQKGNPNPAVKYLLNTNGLNVQLRQNGFSYDVYETKKIPLTQNEKKILRTTSSTEKDSLANQNFKLEYSYHRIDIDFVNYNSSVRLVSEGKISDYDNYYNVVSKPEGVLNVYKFQKVTYQNIYPHIDVVFFIPEDKSKPVEYNFVIKPNGKISDIQLKFKGAKTALVDNKIKMNVRFGIMEETMPFSWTENDKKAIAISYKKISKNTYGFKSSENLDNKTIIIDPVPIRLWGTYYGLGSNFELIALDTDSSGNLYFSGHTGDSANMATAGSHDTTLTGFSDGFLAKFDTNGTRIWGTYYGGNNSDSFYALKQSNNELVLTGGTNSTTNISTPGSFKETLTVGGFNNLDVFIVKFDLNGQRVWGTYFGGENTDYPLNLDLDPMNNIVIVGETYSINGIATPGTFKDYKSVPVNPNTVGEGFITKFNPSGFQIWGSYYFLCEIRGVGIDSNSNIFFSGDVSNNTFDFTTSGTHQPNFIYNTDTGVANYSSYLIKFDPNGQRIWGTYYGKAWEYNHCLKIDHNDDIILSGYTRSTELIATLNAHQPNLNPNAQSASDAYLAKFNQSGQLVWGTYYGGDDQEDLQRYTIDIDESNNIFLEGNTMSTNNISTIDSYNYTPNGWYDAFIVKFNPLGVRLWGTYFGGNNGDFATTIKYDKQGIFFIAGNTYSPNEISTAGSYQPLMNGSRCFFIEKFKDCLSATEALSNNPCIGEDLNLTASGGTNYTWTGPNGFTSNLQNPTITNANATHSGQYTCVVTGTGGCDNTITVDVIVGDVTKPIPDILNLPTINGDCTTVIPIPTATDNCSGIVNGTTTNPLNYPLPGTYTVQWNYDDGNGNIETQNQTVVISAVTLPIANSPQTFCIQQNATVNNIAITGQNIQWYDAPTGGNLLNSTTALQNGTTYYVSQTLNSCESSRVSVTINIQNTPAPIGNSPQSFCALQNPTLNDITVTGTAINWYSSTTSTTVLPSNTLLVDGTVYFATQTVNGCESINRLAITISLIFSLNANDYATNVCDEGNNGTEMVDLSQFDSFLINTSGNTFSYYKTYNGAENQIIGEELATNHTLNLGLNIIYVRIDSMNGCHQIVQLQLTLVPVPIITISDEIILCERGIVSVQADSGFDSYLWSTNATSPSIVINQAGNYSVTVTENHGSVTCSSTKNFTVVLSNAPTITSIDTVDWTDSENSITVNAVGLGDYEYAIDGINFQNSNVFNGLPNGAYLVTVRDKKECGIATEQVFLLNYPKFFTPNSDGNNDGWSIKFSQFEPNFEVRIFDRYGKLLRVMKNNEAWDGNYNGRQLPSDDYWFYVTRADGKIHKGHFAMKR